MLRIERKRKWQWVVRRRNGVLLSERTRAALFVDVGYYGDGHTGWGLVMKDQNGVTTLSACKREHISVEPALAEAMGVLWGMQVVAEENLGDVTIYTDAETVSNCINDKSVIVSLEPVILDCKAMLPGLPNARVCFVRRSSNNDAHALAAKA